MKQIITPGNPPDENVPLMFTCHRCSCEFKSDEYQARFTPFTYTDMMCGTTRRQVKGYVDVCPECSTRCCVIPQDKVFVYE